MRRRRRKARANPIPTWGKVALGIGGGVLAWWFIDRNVIPLGFPGRGPTNG